MTKIQLKRGLEKDLPELADGEPGFTEDTGKLFIGSPTGNIQIFGSNAAGGSVPNTQSWVSTDNQDTFIISSGSINNIKSLLVFVGGIIQPNITLINNKTFKLPETISGGIDVYAIWFEANSSSSPVILQGASEYEWITAEGQLSYTLPSGQTYDVNSKWIEIFVGGSPMPDSQIQKDSPTQFTLLIDSSKIKAGMLVFARWTQPYIPATSGHSVTHQLGGTDEIDITKLKNFNEQVTTPLTQNVKKIDNKSIISPLDYGAVADGTSHPLSTKYTTLADAQAYFGLDFKGRQIATALTDELDLCALRKALNDTNSVVILPYGKTFLVNSSFCITNNKKIIAIGSKIKLNGFGSGGHIVEINGDKTNISNPIPVVNISWEGGLIDGTGYLGCNGFGIEAAENILISNVEVDNCKRDIAIEGGRGFTCHPASRNVTVIGCRAYRCSTGFDSSTKADALDGVTDNLKQRTRNINFINSIANECEYSGFNIEQSNNPANIDLISQDVTVSGCQFINCGSNWTNRGIINANRATNLTFVDCTIYNDVNFPVGTVFRGSFHKSTIKAKVQVDTLMNLIDSTPTQPVNGIDTGDATYPNGAMQDNRFDISYYWKNISGVLFAATDYAGTSIDLMNRNYFIVKLYNETTQFTANMISGGTHYTNVAEVHDTYNNRYARFRFNLVKPLSSTWLD